jgi:hypothetical protein
LGPKCFDKCHPLKKSRYYQSSTRSRCTFDQQPYTNRYFKQFNIKSFEFLGVELCLAASQCDLLTLKAWKEAGASLNDADYDGRTALHVVRMGLFITYIPKKQQVQKHCPFPTSILMSI